MKSRSILQRHMVRFIFLLCLNNKATQKKNANQNDINLFYDYLLMLIFLYHACRELLVIYSSYSLFQEKFLQ